MEHNLADSIALLSRTPSVLDALLRDMPATWTDTREGEATWTPTEVVAHMAQAERNDWLPRIRIVLQPNEPRTFPPFDRTAHLREENRKPLAAHLDDFATLRAVNLTELRALNISPADFSRVGNHPSFGPVTLSQLIATWATHDLSHLHQISRVMAHQYSEAVGPWKQFLGVLNCTGHGA